MTSCRTVICSSAAALTILLASPASASDTSEVEAVVARWVADFNTGNFKRFVAACTANAAIIDGFPPYVWRSCTDWIDGYLINNKRVHATHGTLSLGKLAYVEVNHGRAYAIYPVTFSDTQGGKPVVYKGSWTMTLQKVRGRWAFTGSASAWSDNTL